MLFGYSEDEVLHVLLASTAGLSSWYEADARVALNIDPRFALGWGEALRGLFGSRLDWIGNWVIHPDAQLKSSKRDLRRFRGGFESGLIDDRSILLVVGYMDGTLRTRAYSQVFEEGAVILDSVSSATIAHGQVWKESKP